MKIDWGLLLRAAEPVGPSISVTAARLNEWLKSMANATAVAETGEGPELVERIAERLIPEAGEIERKLLSKSLQELIYLSIGFNVAGGFSEIQSSLQRCIARRGVAYSVKRFLALYFFNHVWFATSDSFRMLARTPELFEQYMAAVEKLCQRTVASEWKAFEKTKQSIDIPAVADLIQNIDRRLRRVPVSRKDVLPESH